MNLATTGSRVLIWRTLQKAANAVVVVVVAQGLGPEGNGRYSLALLVITVLAALFNGGVGLASVPPLRQHKIDPRRILGAQALWMAMVAGILILLGVLVRFTGLWHWLEEALTWDLSLILVAGAAILALLLFETANYDLLAAGRVVLGTRVAAVRALFHLGAMGLLLVLARLDLTLALLTFALVHGLAAIFMAWQARRVVLAMPPAPQGEALLGLMGGLLRRGWLGQLSALTYLLLLRLDQLFIEGSHGVAAVGIYALAAWGGELLWLVPEALNPLLVHSSADVENPTARDQTAARAVRIVLLVTFLAAIPAAFLVTPVLGLLRNGEFLAAAGPFRVLLPGIVAFAPGAVLAGDFIGRGRPHWNTQASIVTVVVNVGLCLLWIPSQGIMGAAWASTVAYAMGAVVMLVRFHWATNIPWHALLLPRFSDFRR